MVGTDSTFSHVDGSVFHVTTFGDRSGAGGSPLAQAAGVGTEDGCIVLVQGHGGTKTGWRPLAEDFASRGYFVITFDNRGVGCTTVLGQDDFDMTDATNPRAALFTYSDMADDVVQLMDHFHVQRAHIAGASMGGQITTLVGVRHPERCLSITVIMSASPIIGPDGAVNVARARHPDWFEAQAGVEMPVAGDSLETVLAALSSNDSAINDVTANLFPGTELILPGQEEADLLLWQESVTIDYQRGAIDYAPMPLNALQTLAGQAWVESEEGLNIKTSLQSLAVPAIWIGGRHDPIIPIETQRATAALVPNGRIYEFDCGHEMPQRTISGMVAIMVAHFDSAVERNRDFRHSVQDLDSSLSRLGPHKL